MDTAELIWQNGEFVPWHEAQTHVLSHGLHYGTGVFEGIRCYDTESKGPAVFRHQEHIARLFKSASLYYMDIPFTAEQLREATLELIGRNGQRSCYIRPLVYRGYGTMGLFPLDAYHAAAVPSAASRSTAQKCTIVGVPNALVVTEGRQGRAHRPCRSSHRA